MLEKELEALRKCVGLDCAHWTILSHFKSSPAFFQMCTTKMAGICLSRPVGSLYPYTDVSVCV